MADDSELPPIDFPSLEPWPSKEPVPVPETLEDKPILKEPTIITMGRRSIIAIPSIPEDTDPPSKQTQRQVYFLDTDPFSRWFISSNKQDIELGRKGDIQPPLPKPLAQSDTKMNDLSWRMWMSGYRPPQSTRLDPKVVEGIEQVRDEHARIILHNGIYYLLDKGETTYQPLPELLIGTTTTLSQECRWVNMRNYQFRAHIQVGNIEGSMEKRGDELFLNIDGKEYKVPEEAIYSIGRDANGRSLIVDEEEVPQTFTSMIRIEDELFLRDSSVSGTTMTILNPHEV